MKTAALKKSIALTLIAALIGLLPGPRAYADAPVAVEGAAEAANVGGIALPGISIGGAAAVEAPAAYVSAAAATQGVRLPGVPSAATTGAALGSVSGLGSQAVSLPQDADALSSASAAAPAAAKESFVGRWIQRLRGKAPDVSNLSEADAQGAAAADFYAKIGQAYQERGGGDAAVRVPAGAAPRDASREFLVPSARLSGYLSASPSSERSRVIVQAPESVSFKRDYHVDWVDWNQPDAMDVFRDEVGGMYVQLAAAGLSAELLDSIGARPIANYRQIGAATLEVPSDKRAALEQALAARGFAVYENRIVRMTPPAAEQPLGLFTKAVTLHQVTQITGADKVQEILKAELASSVDPSGLNLPGFIRPAALWLLSRLGAVKTPVSPAGSIIDTGNDPDHPMLKGHYAINAKDEEGHGTWVGSAVTSFDPWQKNLRSYNTFADGSASTDDILRDLTKADNDGAEWFTNSWGDDEGDPNSPDSQLVRKIAAKGKVFFFAAGNAGSGDNTVGGPAIAYTRDPKTGADLIVSVGATDGAGDTAYFQSRGPWSPTIAEHPDQYKDYPNRVDIQSVGHKVYGAYPTYMSGADKNDPVLGPQKEESGTSMSTPTLGGAYSLLREFGFAPIAVVKALLDSAKNTGKPAAEGGRGFLDVHAAYLQLKQARDSKPLVRLQNALKPWALKLLGRSAAAR